MIKSFFCQLQDNCKMSSQPSTSNGNGKASQKEMVRFNPDQKNKILEFVKNHYQDLYGNKLAGAQQLKQDKRWLELVTMAVEE